MSLPRPSGLKAPSKIGKPTGLPLPKSSIPAPDKAKSAIAKSARAAGFSATQADKYATTVVNKLAGPEYEVPPPPSDDFKIGDRVWVGGSKPGVIAFLGETQFAAGEWAGVALDKQEGKNDGSVKGIRYFQCESDRGVFARISKLSRTPGLLPMTSKMDDTLSETPLKPNGPARRPTTPSVTPSRGVFGSNTSLSRASPAPGTRPGSRPALKVGDRVFVSGSKMGTLQYIGETDFAKGEWAGVELDEKQGKNDGAVAGKRYFECKPMYGLFAPIHKVTRLTSGTAGPGKPATTPTSQSRSLMNTSLRLSKERSGSQESVSSISSSASSVSRSRVRLGVTSLGNQLPLHHQRKRELTSTPIAAKPGHRPSTLNLTATTTALQKALKEKEEHIEQLLKERDLERSEVARAAAQCDEAEGQMSMMRSEQERYKQDVDDTVLKLRSLVADMQQEKVELVNQLDTEKRKVEDLQFQIEEEAMTKDDMESRTEEEEMKFREIERLQQREKERADKLEQELYAMKAMAKDNTEKLESTEELNITYLDQIEEITHKLSQAETKIKGYESNRLEEGAKTSQVSLELEEKEHKISELEEILTTKNKEVKQLSNNLQEVEEDLFASREKNNHMKNQVDKLTSQMDNQSKASETFNLELQQLKSQISDLQRKLASSEDKAKRLNDEKIQLEQQMSDMMRNSGDSSKRLSILTEQLQDRNRKIQDLQADLSSSTQQSAKLREEKDRLRKEGEKERENLIVKHNDVVNTIKLTLQDVQKELSKSNNKMTAMKEDFEKDKEDAINRKITEINNLKKNLEQSKADLEKQEVQTQAHKQVLDKINMEMEALKFEKEKADKMVKRLESEKDSINTDLIHIRVTNSKVQLEYEKMVDEKNKLQQQIEDLKEDKDKVSETKSSIQQEKEELVTEKTKLVEENDKVNRELVESKASLQQKDIQIEELQKEVEKMKTEVNEKEEAMSQKSQSQSHDLQTQIEKAQARVKELDGMLQSEISHGEKRVKELEKKLLMQTSETDQRYNQLEALFKEVEDERDTMKAQLEFSNLVAEERRRLEEQNMQLNQEMEKTEDRKEIESLEKTKISLQKEVANLKNDNASLEKFRHSTENQEQENKDLISQINSLKSQLQAQEVNSNTIGLSANEVEDKQTIDGQVEFLNSVIVDLQKKNGDLKTRLEAMESGVITNGEANSSMEEVSESKKPPPRLFCDICDVFDKHDTEDCPCQAMDYDDDTPSPSHHHGDRKQLRPYCDICEEFHKPCENLQILIPEGKTSLPEPKVRYHSGSETVEIECSEDKGNVHTEEQNQFKESCEDFEIKHYNDGRLLSNEDEMSNSQLGIYDDDDFKDEKDNETNLEQVVNTVLENEVDPILDNCKHTDITDVAHMNKGAVIREKHERRDDEINTGHESDNESMEEFIDKNDDRANDVQTQEQRKSDESDEYGNGVEESDVTTEEDDEKGNNFDESDKKNDSDIDYSNQEKDENIDEFHDTEGDGVMEANGLPINNYNNSGQVSEHHVEERKLETSDNRDSVPIEDGDNSQVSKHHEEERKSMTYDNRDVLPIDDKNSGQVSEHHDEEQKIRTDDNRDALPFDDNKSGQVSERHEEERMLKTDDNRDSCKIS
ncbi:CAP-Gly domain-containing linker protein 1-like isoform X2 [Mytilus californianus]|uniref:CAP-Gly domain-containing linker protein 1-like isoform X2 n=1 Tax=Mytilus californianus TaxID=6549 RepID=UPI00224752EE|nr:CAP-Gly domain-containing linker protein 1-like isoform X2 [Mytilus californianus]